MSDSLTKRESISIDIMKSFCVLSVMAAHLVARTNDNRFILRIIEDIWASYARVGVIVFLALGGFLYHRSDGDDKLFWKKKIYRIIIPWLVCSAATFVLSIVAGVPASLSGYIKWIFGSGSWYYYVSIYLLFIWVFKWIQKSDTLLGLSVFLQILVLSLHTFRIIDVQINSFITAYLNPFCWIGYFSLGILIRKYRWDLKVRNSPFCFAAELLIMFVAFALEVRYESFTYFHIVTMIMGLCAGAVIARLSYSMAKYKISAPFVKIGRSSYCIYLLHMQIVQFSADLFPAGIIKTALIPFFGVFLMMVLICIGSWCCNRLPNGDRIIKAVGL